MAGDVGDVGGAGENGTNGTNGTSYRAFSRNDQTGTTYTMQSSDFAGNVLVTFNNASAITVTVPSGLTAPEPCVVKQLGAGQVTFVASGTTFSYANGLKLYGQGSAAVLMPLTTANAYGFDGDTST